MATVKEMQASSRGLQQANRLIGECSLELVQDAGAVVLDLIAGLREHPGGKEMINDAALAKIAAACQ